MLSTYGSAGARCLHEPSNKAANVPITSLRSPSSRSSYHLSRRRTFSWGSKHKSGSKNAGKVWKGFSTQEHTRVQKQLYRGNFWKHRYGYTPPLQPYLPLQEWRLSSSWRTPGTAYTKAGQADTSHEKRQKDTEEDWYARYQRQKKQQYDDFVKKIEEDPIGMLFGRKWAEWIDGAETKLAGSSALKMQPEASSGRTNPRPSNGSSVRATSGMRPSERKDTAKQPKTDVVSESQEEEYQIDPITNRKVRKLSPRPKTPPPTLGSEIPTQKPWISDEIPVKPFIRHTTDVSPSSRSQGVDKSIRTEVDIEKPRQWLVQEGFGFKQENMSTSQPKLNNLNLQSEITTSRIESALDRHLQAKSLSDPQPKVSKLRCDPKENTTEDVDLLRSSDVRASAGYRGKVPRANEVDKQIRQQQIQKESEIRELERENQLAKELAADSRYHRISRSGRGPVDKEAEVKTISHEKTLKTDLVEHKALHTEWVNELPDTEPAPTPMIRKDSSPSSKTAISVKADKIKAQLVPLKVRLDLIKSEYDTLRQRWLEEKHRKEEIAAKRARHMHEDEVRKLKTTMESIEFRGFNCTPVRNTNDTRSDEVTTQPAHARLQSLLPGEGDMASNVHEFASRDRWYKRKAPHAKDEMDVKFQELAKNKALIREVREIYEDTYGVIDTSHRQLPQGEGGPKPESKTESPVFATIQSPKAAGPAIPSKPDQTCASVLQPPLQDMHSFLLGNESTSDPLATIQNLYDELRRAQALVREHRRMPGALVNDQGREALVIIHKLFFELRQTRAMIMDYRSIVNQISSPEEFASMLETVRRTCGHMKDGTTASDPGRSEPAPVSQFSNLPPSSKVRREEAVFSGRSHGNWQEKERRRSSNKHKRARKHVRRSKLKSVLFTATFTAACCYAVGIISQMMK